jgi:hypothetical protein
MRDLEADFVAAKTKLSAPRFFQKWRIPLGMHEQFLEALETAYSDGAATKITLHRLAMKQCADGSLEPESLSKKDLKDLRDACRTTLRALSNAGIRLWLQAAETRMENQRPPPSFPPWEHVGHPVPTVKHLLWSIELALELDGRAIEAKLSKERETRHLGDAAAPLWFFFISLPTQTGAIAKSSGLPSGYTAAVDFVVECLTELFPDDKRVNGSTIHSLLKPLWEEGKRRQMPQASSALD